MERKRVHLWSLHDLKQLRALGSITLCFAIGSAVGCWCSVVLEQEGSAALRSWLESYLSLPEASEGGGRWLPALWQMLRLPLLFSLLQFSVLGMIIVPLLMGIRGFLLSFAVTGFVRTYAWRGMLASLLLFAPLGLVEVTALFLLAVAAFLRAEGVGSESRGAAPLGPPPWIVCLSWLLMVLAAVGPVFLAAPLGNTLASLFR